MALGLPVPLNDAVVLTESVAVLLRDSDWDWDGDEDIDGVKLAVCDCVAVVDAVRLWLAVVDAVCDGVGEQTDLRPLTYTPP